MTRIISSMKKRENVIGNLGIVVFQTSLVVFLNASSYGLDSYGQVIVPVCSVVAGAVGGLGYVWAFCETKGKTGLWRWVLTLLLVGIFLCGLFLVTVGEANLTGWIRLFLSIGLQFMSLSLGWLASEQLSGPRGGVSEHTKCRTVKWKVVLGLGCRRSVLCVWKKTCLFESLHFFERIGLIWHVVFWDHGLSIMNPWTKTLSVSWWDMRIFRG